MLMNRLESALVNSPPRRWLQRFEAAHLVVSGGRTPGARVVELGCGTKLILDVFGAARVDAVDLDPALLVAAAQRLARYPGRVSLVEDQLPTWPPRSGRTAAGTSATTPCSTSPFSTTSPVA